MTASHPQAPSILLVEDDPGFAAMLCDALSARGYHLWHAASAAEAEALLGDMRADLILLDLILPDRNGLALCVTLKGRSGVPLIVCSATRRKDDRVLAFKLGADDFLAKPFSLDELQARIEVALQRGGTSSRNGARPPEPRVQHIGALVIDRAQRRVTLGDDVLQLTPTEYYLLCALASRPAEVVSRSELAESVWSSSDASILRSLDVHMRRLRAKIKAAGGGPTRLVTRRGFGYQLLEDANTPT